ncbi:type III secretion system needle filament subunit SctF [Martelella alba]|uniref:EscF/YscF/HrpA family type III secretion system needle major subunit n=1 Tax=Martelella alba TaxID=2590451 RepID=A0ABY2SGQ8_9HYPH|nr:type III secretion system needle filament subunit SctF [Martelella alba]TKI02798.1 EscF/YscF/HrpA family type III secretion system needle major subunit [Martelella alba]
MGSITAIYDKLAQSVNDANIATQDALEQASNDPSNPMYLAQYQAKLNEYSVVQSLSATAIKKLADLDSLILSKF